MPQTFHLKRALFLTLALVLALPMLAATKTHKHVVRSTVEDIDKQWRAAQIANDTVTMDKLLSDDYLGITGSGLVVTKAQQLDRMRSRQTVITRLDVSDFKVKTVGTVAIVTSLADLEGIMDGKQVHGKFRSTRVYQHLSNGSWKITSFEATPMRADVALPPPVGN